MPRRLAGQNATPTQETYVIASRYATTSKRPQSALEYGPTGIPFGHFVHDQLANGLAFRVLTVVDNWSRESVLLETGFRLTSREVIMALDRAAQSR